MSSARDAFIEKMQFEMGPVKAGEVFDGAVEAITAAGFRILAPDELDPATVERCAQVADEAAKDAYRNAPAASYRSPEDEALVRKTADRIAERIRTLTGGNNGR